MPKSMAAEPTPRAQFRPLHCVQLPMGLPRRREVLAGQELPAQQRLQHHHLHAPADGGAGPEGPMGRDHMTGRQVHTWATKSGCLRRDIVWTWTKCRASLEGLAKVLPRGRKDCFISSGHFAQTPPAPSVRTSI